MPLSAVLFHNYLLTDKYILKFLYYIIYKRLPYPGIKLISHTAGPVQNQHNSFTVGMHDAESGIRLPGTLNDWAVSCRIIANSSMYQYI